MPSKEEFDELANSTKVVWTTINGVNGLKFTNKSDSSKYLFIPASGYRKSSSINDIGSGLYIWSHSLLEFIPSNAWALGGSSDNVITGSGSRSYGHSVRGLL